MPHVSADAFKIEPGNVSAQMMRMCTDVDQDHRAADALRIKPPSRRHVLRGKISLNVLQMQLANRSDRSGAYHGPRLTHHGICRVGVR